MPRLRPVAPRAPARPIPGDGELPEYAIPIQAPPPQAQAPNPNDWHGVFEPVRINVFEPVRINWEEAIRHIGNMGAGAAAANVPTEPKQPVSITQITTNFKRWQTPSADVMDTLAHLEPIDIVTFKKMTLGKPYLVPIVTNSVPLQQWGQGFSPSVISIMVGTKEAPTEKIFVRKIAHIEEFLAKYFGNKREATRIVIAPFYGYYRRSSSLFDGTKVLIMDTFGRSAAIYQESTQLVECKWI